jgi:hypothetical protein
MRKPLEIAVDRALLLHLLQVVEPQGLMTDVKLQQLAFLCELKLFDEQLKGFHFEFFRYAYGAFSKDLDNDLLWLRRKERLEAFQPTDKAREALILLGELLDHHDTNRRVGELMDAVIATYGSQDASAVSNAVDSIELSTPDRPEFKVQIATISFHSTLLVPARIQVKAEFTIPSDKLSRLTTALGS